MSGFRSDWRDWFAFFCFCLMFAGVLIALSGAIWLLGHVVAEAGT